MRFSENPAFGSVTHSVVFILYIYVFYLMYQDPEERHVANFLLLIIALSIAALIHQNVNENGENGVHEKQSAPIQQTQ